MKKCSSSLAIKEIQIKTSMRFHLIPVRMAVIKKKRKLTMINAGKYEEIGSLIHCWWKCKLLQALWKPTWRVLKKLKIELLLYYSWSYIQRTASQHTVKIPAHPCL
jgi:hypothetical protein